MEETGLQRNGTRSSLTTNPDSISAVVTIVFVYGDPVVNASILLLLYSDTPHDCLQYTITPGIDPWHHDSLAARVSQDCLRTVATLLWPSRSPNPSPIEHIWDHLGRQVGRPMSFNELEARLQQIWNEMSQDIIQNLYPIVHSR
ncbi:uncharacterized protein TNCV_2037661 [Trichonephila clavipes]|nr:uncharacterized protein TNCV_2037661 [Trichonephila clavipes]